MGNLGNVIFKALELRESNIAKEQAEAQKQALIDLVSSKLPTEKRKEIVNQPQMDMASMLQSIPTETEVDRPIYSREQLSALMGDETAKKALLGWVLPQIETPLQKAVGGVPSDKIIKKGEFVSKPTTDITNELTNMFAPPELSNQVDIEQAMPSLMTPQEYIPAISEPRGMADYLTDIARVYAGKGGLPGAMGAANIFKDVMPKAGTSGTPMYWDKGHAMDSGYDLDTPEGLKAYKDFRNTPEGKQSWNKYLDRASPKRNIQGRDPETNKIAVFNQRTKQIEWIDAGTPLVATQYKPLSEADSTFLAGTNSILRGIENIKEMFGTQGGKLGPIEGRYNVALQKFRSDSDFERFQREANLLVTQAFRMGGRTLTSTEKDITMAAMIPILQQKPENFMATLEHMKDVLLREKEEKLKTLEGTTRTPESVKAKPKGTIKTQEKGTQKDFGQRFEEIQKLNPKATKDQILMQMIKEGY